MSAPDRRAMLDRDRPGCRSGGSAGCWGWRARASTGQRRRPTTTSSVLMRRLDELFMRLAVPRLAADGRDAAGRRARINRKRVQRLMRQMGIAALGPRPHDQAGAGAQDLPVSAARPGDRPAQPGLGGRHHLHPDRARLPLPGRDHGLGEPGGAGVAAVEHDGRRVLRRGAGGGAGALRHAGDLQHRPGQPVHRRRLHRRPAAAGVRISMDGRGRWMDNVFIERLWRSLKYEDIYLKGYADGREAQRRDRRLDRLLQRHAAASGARRPHADGGVARRRSPAPPARQGCGHDAARLDDASASPTCPPPQQQQTIDVA